MNKEYILSHTAPEIDQKLSKIDTLISILNGIVPDKNGNVEINRDSAGIIDVVTLPETNAKENTFYRLLTAKFAAQQVIAPEDSGFICHCVDTLPETGKTVTNIDMSYMIGYYSLADNEIYGYVDDMLGSAFGIPAGWYPFGTLAQVAGLTWGGIITDISDSTDDGTLSLLLSYDYYVYKNGWTKLIFASEQMPIVYFQYDGIIGDRFALDLAPLFPGSEEGSFYIVKMSDISLTVEELKGLSYIAFADWNNTSYSDIILEDDIDTSYMPGVIAVTVRLDHADYPNCLLSCYDCEQTNAAMGLPAGTLTNGIYTLQLMNDYHIASLATAHSPIINKIDSKYLDLNPLHNIAFSGDYNDLSNTPLLATVATTGNYNNLLNRPTIYTDVIRYNTTQGLSSTSKTIARTNIDVYSKSEVDNKISNAVANVDLTEYAKTSEVETLIAQAISGAIGGSY